MLTSLQEMILMKKKHNPFKEINSKQNLLLVGNNKKIKYLNICHSFPEQIADKDWVQ